MPVVVVVRWQQLRESVTKPGETGVVNYAGAEEVRPFLLQFVYLPVCYDGWADCSHDRLDQVGPNSFQSELVGVEVQS